MPLLETLLYVSGGAKALGGVLSFLGGRRAASAAEREGARLAADALRRGEETVDRYEMDVAQLLGTQRANTAAQGLDVNFGSALQLREQTERFAEEDVETIRENAAREARALRRGGRNQAQQLRMQATGDILGAAGTVLNLGANAWDTFSRGRAMNTRIADTVGRDLAAWG